MLTGLSQINLQIMWHRLISVVEEQAQTLLRTAFSSMVRECGDLSAGVFDMNGRMLAQAVTGTPGHVNSMAESVKHFLRYFPAETMKPGDIYITNDPWMGTGHLNDFVLTTPAFHKGRMIALFSCTSHLIDIGGIGFGPDATDVHMEGIYIPFLKLADQGEMNDTLLAMIRANTRQPVESEGDVYSLAACNDIGCQRLSEMMGEFELDDLVELGGYIEESSRAAGLTELAKLPNGVYQNTMRIDGYDAPLDLCATVTVSDTGIHVDFDGTSPESRYGINVPLSYTTAYTCFGLSCIVAPKVPNNAGSLGLMSVSAPSGCILNAQKPAAVSSRHIIGQLLPDVVFGCLRQAASERTPAEGTSCLYNINMRGRTLGANEAGAGYVVTAVTNGGTGARPTKDGLSATAYPSGVRASPIEILESIAPLVFWRKELRPDSGGAGQFRGGHGQYLEIENRDLQNFELLAAFDRIDNPPRGHDGGADGAKGRISLSSGTVLKGKGFQDIPAGQRLMVETPGGAGIGNPHNRAPEAIVADIRNGLVTPDAAERDYAYAASKGGA